MSSPKVYQWIQADNEAIVVTNDYDAGFLPLNGTLFTETNPLSIKFPGFSRVVTVTSADDIIAVVFTVNGIYNGQPVQDVIGGINGDTVQGVQLFDSIISITVDEDVTNTSVGIGLTGHTAWLLADYDRNISNFTFQAIKPPEDLVVVTYSLICTLQDISNTTTLAELDLFDPTGDMTDQGISSVGFCNAPLRYLAFNITNSNANGSLTGIILEGG